MIARSDRDAIVFANGESEWWKRGARGTIAHEWGSGKTDVVPVTLLASPKGGEVPVLATPHDGGDFYLLLRVQEIVPLPEVF